MNIPKHPTLIQRSISARIKELKADKPVLSASLVKIAKHCGRQGCKCQRGEKHVGNYITFPVKGKTNTVYVPLDLVEEVKSWIEEHKRIKKITKEISELMVAKIKAHVKNRKRKIKKS
jgi:hypothetical protein